MTPFTRAKKIGTARQNFGTVPCLPVLRPPPVIDSDMDPLSQYSPVTLHLSPATRILNENIQNEEEEEEEEEERRQ